MKKIKKFASILSLIVILSTSIAEASPLVYPETVFKTVSHSITSSTNNFNLKYHYSKDGYSGDLSKDGNSFVSSGSAPIGKQYSTSITNQSGLFDNLLYVSNGGYSGYVSKDGSYTTSSTNLNASGTVEAVNSFRRVCIKGGNKVPNTNFDPAKFDVNDNSTWPYREVGSVWGSEEYEGGGVGVPPGASQGGFDVNWIRSPRNSLQSASYQGYPAKISSSVSVKTSPIYLANPGNNYTPAHTGQAVPTRIETTTYNLSINKTINRYTQNYSGTIYTPDTRVWQQNYAGIVSKVINQTLNAEITHTIPTKIEENTSLKVQITAKNTGTLPWSENDLIRLKDKNSSLKLFETLKLPDNVVVNSGASYTWEVTIPPLQKGDYNVGFQMIKDNGDGYFGNEVSETLKAYNFIPINDALNVTNYDYYKDNKYYIKNNTNVNLEVTGYLDSFIGLYPNANYIMFKENDVEESVIQKTDNTSTKLTGTGINNFTLVGNSKISNVSENNRNYAKNTQTYNINMSGDIAYKLYNKTSLFRNGIEYSNGFTDSGKWLYVDNVAPAVKDNTSINISSDETKIYTEVKDIIEVGSGIKDVTVEYSYGSNVIKKPLTEKNSIFTDTIKISDLNSGNIDFVDVKIVATDNVGNENILANDKFYLFDIKARIEKTLDPNSNVFKGGEQGKLIIEVKGGVEKLKITFPQTLTSIADKELNKEIMLDPNKSKDTVIYEFFVPLYAPEQSYNVQVKGFKNTMEKEVYPRFEVKDSILSQIRTRIRIR